MGEFFKGWRRKAGLVTLAMACALMVGWVRSSVVCDQLFIPLRASGLWTASVKGQLGCVRHTDWHEPIEWYSADTSVFPDITIFDEIHHLDSATSQWSHFGFRFGAGRIPTPTGGAIQQWDSFQFCYIPYWSLVLPLTLLSAWLILGKRRKPCAADSGPSEI